MRYGEVLASRMAAQQEMGNWLTGVLTEVAYPHRVIVTVELGLEGRLREIVDKETRPPVDLKLGVKKKVKLPGLPTTDKNVGAPGMSVKMPGASRTVIQHELDTHVRKIAVRLFVDKDMPQDRVEEVTRLAGALAGVDPAHGDTLEVVTVENLPTNQEKAVAGFPSWIVVLACATVLASCLFLALALARRGGESTTRVVGDLAAASATQGAVAGAPADADDDEEEDEAVAEGANGHARPRAFAFLSDVPDDELVEVLARLEPEQAAMVLDQAEVSPEAERMLFEQLPTDRQLAIVTALGTQRIVPAARLADVEATAEDVLTIVRSRRTIGGHDRLAALLEQAPEAARERLLEQLAKTDPALNEAIRGRMLIFEDLEHMSNDSIRQVVAEIDPTITARALHGAPEAVRAAVMQSVSKRLRAILEAEDEALAANEQADDQINDARRIVEQSMRRVAHQHPGRPGTGRAEA